MTDKLLSVVGLTISLRLDSGLLALVDDVSFDVAPGEVLALVGESGSGKSVTALSLLRLLPNNMDIHSGQILYASSKQGATIDLAHEPQHSELLRSIRGNEIAMIFQEPMASFSPVHTIGEHIADVLRAHGLTNPAEARERTVELLDRVKLPDPSSAVDRYPHELSGGMRQRAMIAKALCLNPSLLIADEPTTALDVTIQAQILELLRELREDLGMALIFITHDLAVVAQIADRVAVMYTGKLVEQGPKRELFHHQSHPYTRELLAATPRLGQGDEPGGLRSIRGHVPGPFDLPSGCTFHPRCDSFIAGRCELSFPAEVELGDTHRVSCHLYG